MAFKVYALLLTVEFLAVLNVYGRSVPRERRSKKYCLVEGDMMISVGDVFTSYLGEKCKCVRKPSGKADTDCDYIDQRVCKLPPGNKWTKTGRDLIVYECVCVQDSYKYEHCVTIGCKDAYGQTYTHGQSTGPRGCLCNQRMDMLYSWQCYNGGLPQKNLACHHCTGGICDKGCSYDNDVFHKRLAKTSYCSERSSACSLYDDVSLLTITILIYIAHQ